MKLKDIIQITVFTVIAFVLGMAVSMGTGMLGTVSLYVASGFSCLLVLSETCAGRLPCCSRKKNPEDGGAGGRKDWLQQPGLLPVKNHEPGFRSL